jgi:hypothetical protein
VRAWLRLLAAPALAWLLFATACRPRQLDEAGLAALIDELLPSIAAASGLEIRGPVDYTLQSREEARAFIVGQLDEEMPDLEEMRRSYVELGLLPDTLDLRALLLELYTEQVVGYYDPRTRRLYLVEGVRREEAAPVVAHELVHALQDQHVDLEALVHRRRGNDRQMAAQAAAEGQATLVMLALQAAETLGRPLDPGALPDLDEFLGPALEEEHAGFPVFDRAPRIIRESLLFPYIRGAAFVQALHRYKAVDDPPPIPFGPLLPTSTQQILHPVDRFILERAEPLEIRADPPAGEWRLVYENTLGQFEVGVLLAEHLGEPAREVARGWAGDRYFLLEDGAGRTALVWYSAWADDAAARRFATRYSPLLERRTDRATQLRRADQDGQPLVVLVQAPAGADPGAVTLPPLRTIQPRPDL